MKKYEETLHKIVLSSDMQTKTYGYEYPQPKTTINRNISHRQIMDD